MILAARILILMMLMLTACAASAADLESQKNVYLLRVDRANQRISLFDSVRKRIPIEVEYKDESGKPVRETLNSLPVLTKTVRFIAPEGPQIPNDPYGKYCESPPADGRDGMWYHVGPIIDIPEGSMDFGYYKVRITGKPADIHGRTGLLLHGGGKNRPNPLAEFQGWQCTHGCIRLQNAHMRALVQTLRSLPQDAEIRLIIDGGKCKLNDITAETYRWNEERADWDILEAE